MRQPRIPAFLSIDVEPNGFQLSNPSSASWSGFEAAIGQVTELRGRLAVACESSPVFGWYVRADPQLAACYGRADVALRTYEAELRQLCGAGDYLGVHAHAVRWSEQRQSWIHDFDDTGWGAYCAETALHTFAQATGTAAERFRAGAGFLDNPIIEVLDRKGVKVELSLEPMPPWPAAFDRVPSGIDDSEYVGAHVDCRTALQVPYYPSAEDFRVRSRSTARRVCLVPMTTFPYVDAGAGWHRRLRARLPRLAHRRRVLHLSEPWPSSDAYWDVVQSQLLRMRRPYVSIALRTDPPGSGPWENAMAKLTALMTHPIGRRLDFVDPLQALPSVS